MTTKTNQKKNPYDTTSTKRQGSHLERLAADGGERKVVDLSGAHMRKLDDLKAAGYARSAADVIRRAIDDAHAALAKKS